MQYRQIEAKAPWTDVPRKDGDIPKGHDNYVSKYDAAILELHDALKDGQRHHREVAEKIVEKHEIHSVQALCDRAGVYVFYTDVIWVGAPDV